MGRPRTDDSGNARTQRVVIYITPEKYADLKTLSAFDEKPVAGYIASLIDDKLHSNKKIIEQLRYLKENVI